MESNPPHGNWSRRNNNHTHIINEMLRNEIRHPKYYNT